MHDLRGKALVVVLGLGLVASLLRLNRGVLTRGQRAFRLVIAGLMAAGLAVVWFARS